MKRISRACAKASWRGFVALAPLLILFFPARAPGDPNEWIAQAEAHYARGDYPGALEAFQRASWERPQDPVLHYNMAVLAETIGRMDAAVDHYLAYLRWDLNSEDRDAVKRRVFQLCGTLGSAAYRDQDYDHAVLWYQKAAKLFPNARAVYYNLGKVYDAMGNVPEAARCVQEYWTRSDAGDRTEAARWLASLKVRQAEGAFSAGQVEDALGAFRDARKWDENDPEAFLGMARCEERLGMLGPAQEHYTRFLEMAPEAPAGPDVLARLGRIVRAQAESMLREGDASGAEKILVRGLKQNPEDRDLHYLLAKTFLATGRNLPALQQLEEVCRLTPVEQADPVIQDVVRLSLLLADEAYRKQDYASVIRVLNTAQFWDSDNPVLAYNLAETYDRQGEIVSAVQAYRKYLSLAPEASDREEVRARMAYLYYVYGSERYRNGFYPEAQEAFEQALLLRPYDPALLYNLAQVLLRRGDTKAAIHFFERYAQHEENPAEVQWVQQKVAELRNLSEQEAPSPIPPAIEETAAVEDGPPVDLSWMAGLGRRPDAYYRLKNGLWQDAISLYEQHLRQFPQDRQEKKLQEEMALAYREQGRSALMGGQPDRALAALQKARQWAPADSAPYLWAGDLYETLKNNRQALHIYRESLRVVTDPQTRDTVYRKISGILTRELQTALRNQDYETALSTLVEMEPYLTEERRKDVHYQIAQLEMALGRREDALVHYGLHLQQAPAALENARLTDEMLRQMGPDADLQRLFEDPSRARSLGMDAAHRGDNAKALFFLLTARGQDPHQEEIDRTILDVARVAPPSVDPLDLFARSAAPVPAALTPPEKELWRQRNLDRLAELYRQGLYEEGLRTISELETAGPPQTYALLKAAFQEKMGREDDAMKQYRIAIQSSAAPQAVPWAPTAQDHLCDLIVHHALRAYEQGQYGRALSLLQEAQGLAPGRKDVAFNLGCIYFREKNAHKALDAFSRYLALAQGDSPRKILTERAMESLRKQISAAPSVRYDQNGVAMDLVFEHPLTLGELLVPDNVRTTEESEARALVDGVLLVPYVEQDLEKQPHPEEGPAPPPSVRTQ